VAAHGSNGVSVTVSLPLDRTICGISCLFETDLCRVRDPEAMVNGTLRHYRATEQVLARCPVMVEKSDELLKTVLLTLIDLCSHAAKNKNSNVGRWVFSGSRDLVLDYSVPMPCTPG